jgi:hypothetical protein
VSSLEIGGKDLGREPGPRVVKVEAIQESR